MQITSLHKKYDNLQKIYGAKNLDAIYGAGCIKNPDIMFVFMNPTGKNLSSSKDWKGLKAPWISTKNIWKMFYTLGFIEENIFNKIQNKKPLDWDYNFALEVYDYIKSKNLYITNLSKATQVDARPLKNKDFLEYLEVLREEINIIKPKKIITFGNQVSSILLGKSISISDYRGESEDLEVKGDIYKVYPLYYPVGQGMRNMPKVIEDINKIKSI